MVASGAGQIDASPLRPGIVLGGRYRLLARIGAGGMGEVWRAEHMSLGTLAAVKLMDTARGADATERLHRFHQEARAAAQLKSQNIVHVLDHGVEGRFAFIAMELLEGEGLEQRIARMGRLPPAETARIVAGMARGLARAHAAGVLHRDLKPANVFLAREGNAEVVKLLDFGIAKVLDPGARSHVGKALRPPASGTQPARSAAAASLTASGHALPAGAQMTREGHVVGTPSYMSPEQICGREIDVRADLWQVGVIAYECITGRRPFDGATLADTFARICNVPPPSPSSLAPVPPGFDAWAQRALSRDPDARFSSATEMAAALMLVLVPDAAAELDVMSSSTGIRTARLSWSNEAVSPRGSSRRWWIALGVAGVAAGCAVGYVLLGPRMGQATGTSSGAPTSGTAEAERPAPPSPPSPAPEVVASSSAPLASAESAPAPPSSSAPQTEPPKGTQDRPAPSPAASPRQPSKTADPLGI